MIAKVAERGTRLRGLIEYLYGVGRQDEHTNPHLVAAWDPAMLESAMDKAGRGVLVAEMEAPRRLFDVDVAKGPVYHVAISVHVDDGELGDEAWQKVAQRTADKLGFTARDERAGCRWVAVHHGASTGGQDHIHFVADLVREDGTVAEVGTSDYYALAEMRKEMEAELGLRVRTGANRHGERGLHQGEMAAAARRGRPEPDRHALARRVRSAAAGARDETEFVGRLRRDGVLVRPRWATGERRGGRAVGYSVALRPPVRAGQATEKVIWYGGGRLARDLSLPALRQRWTENGTTQDGAEQQGQGQWRPSGWRRDPSSRIEQRQVLRPQAWEAAGAAVAQTRARLAAVDASDIQGWASAAREAAGGLSAMAGRLQPGQRAELARAADALARAGQVPRGGRRGHRDPALVMLGGVARVATDAFLVARGGQVATLTLLNEMAELAADVGRAQQAVGRLAEGSASLAAAEQTLSYVRANALTATGPAPSVAGGVLASSADPFWPAAQPGQPGRPQQARPHTERPYTPRRNRDDERGRG